MASTFANMTSQNKSSSMVSTFANMIPQNKSPMLNLDKEKKKDMPQFKSEYVVLDKLTNKYYFIVSKDPIDKCRLHVQCPDIEESILLLIGDNKFIE